MPARTASPLPKPAVALRRDAWLRKHADYQRVYREGKRQSLPLMTYFFAPRGLVGEVGQIKDAAFVPASRVGITAGRVLGNAVKRNRIKRRMREAVRLHRAELTGSMDVILHPRGAVVDAPFSDVERDVLRALRAVQAVSSPPKPNEGLHRTSGGATDQNSHDN